MIIGAPYLGSSSSESGKRAIERDGLDVELERKINRLTMMVDGTRNNEFGLAYSLVIAIWRAQSAEIGQAKREHRHLRQHWLAKRTHVALHVEMCSTSAPGCLLVWVFRELVR